MPEPCSSFLIFSLYFFSKRASLSLTDRALTVNFGELSPFIYLFIYLFIKILDWQFTIVKIEIEKLKFTIDDKYMAYV